MLSFDIDASDAKLHTLSHLFDKDFKPDDHNQEELEKSDIEKIELETKDE